MRRPTSLHLSTDFSTDLDKHQRYNHGRIHVPFPKRIALPIMQEPSSFLSSEVLALLWRRLKSIRARRDSDYESIEAQFGDPRATARYYIEPECQQSNPADDANNSAFRSSVSGVIHSFITTEHAVRDDGHNHMFILAEPGMGKTSLLVMLKLAEIADFWPKPYKCLLLKLGFDALNTLEATPHKSQTVALLDGLDESPHAIGTLETHINSLLHATVGFRRTIITCRTQLFPLYAADHYYKQPGHIRLRTFVSPLVYLCPFRQEHVERFLRKRFAPAWPIRLFGRRSKRYAESLQIATRMDALRYHPFLLAHIEDFENASDWSEFGLFRALIRSWVDRESRRWERLTGTTLDAEQLLRLCVLLAETMQHNNVDVLSHSQVALLCQQSRECECLARAAEGGYTLLARDSAGNLRFTHARVRAFLLALAVLRNELTYPDSFILAGDTYRFLLQAARTPEFASSGELIARLTAPLRGECLKGVVLRKLVLPRASFKDAFLEDADFQGAHLPDADFQGAYLAGSDFRDAHLTSSNFRDANLVGANCGSANLAQADLRNANLDNCNLHGADLSNANLLGAKVHPSSLAHTTCDGAQLDPHLAHIVDPISATAPSLKEDASLMPELAALLTPDPVPTVPVLKHRQQIGTLGPPLLFAESCQDFAPAPPHFVAFPSQLSPDIVQQLKNGRRVWVQGGSGSGKTTFAECLCRSVYYYGRNAIQQPGRVELRPRKPVLLSMQRVSFRENVIDDMVDAIAAVLRAFDMTDGVRQYLQEGRICIVLDDVDPRIPLHLHVTRTMCEHFQKCWVVVLSAGEPPADAHDQFYRVTMPLWNNESLRRYGARRLRTTAAANELLRVSRYCHVTTLTPYEAKCILDAFEGNALFRFISLAALDGEDRTAKFELWFAGVCAAKNVGVEEATRTLGRVALATLMNGTTVFRQAEFRSEWPMAFTFADAICRQKGELLHFVDQPSQEILAALYVEECWREAAELLRKGPVRHLRNSMVFSIVARNVSGTRLAELDALLRETVS